MVNTHYETFDHSLRMYPYFAGGNRSCKLVGKNHVAFVQVERAVLRSTCNAAAVSENKRHQGRMSRLGLALPIETEGCAASDSFAGGMWKRTAVD